MTEAIIVAIIMAVSSIICQVLINKSNRTKRVEEDSEKEKERAAAEARKEENLANRLNSIEKKLDEHNGYAKLFSDIKTDIAVIKNDIKTLYKQGG